MKANYNKEDLETYLPDFVRDKITDKDLNEAIRNEIQNDRKFESHYLNTKETVNFLETTELEDPGINYFNNLSVKINDRIQKENSKNSIWDRPMFKWKLILPAAALILFTIILYNALTKEPSENMISKTETKIEVPSETNKVNVAEENNTIEKSAEVNTEMKEPIILRERDKKVNSVNPNLLNSEITAEKEFENLIQNDVSDDTTEEEDVLSNLLSGNFDLLEVEVSSGEYDEDLLFPEGFDDSIEEEIMEFSPEELKEILKDINDSQI